MTSNTARSLVKRAAAIADGFRPRHRGVVILLYHRVGGRSGLQVDLPADLFARQMEALAGDGRLTGLGDALDALEHLETPSKDQVVVTFDDGTADFVDVALPILERYSIPATLYLATDHIERGVPFPHDGVPLSWDALQDALSSRLVTVGSHTHTHALLDRLPQRAVEEELDRSVQLIGDRLGVAAVNFAYPKAVRGSASAEAAVRRRFRSAALGGNRVNRYGSADPFRLARSPIQVSDGMRWFERKVEGGMRLEGTLRELLDSRRYAGVAQ